MASTDVRHGCGFSWLPRHCTVQPQRHTKAVIDARIEGAAYSRGRRDGVQECRSRAHSHKVHQTRRREKSAGPAACMHALCPTDIGLHTPQSTYYMSASLSVERVWGPVHVCMYEYVPQKRATTLARGCWFVIMSDPRVRLKGVTGTHKTAGPSCGPCGKLQDMTGSESSIGHSRRRPFGCGLGVV
jgi:hypothetical protein